MKHFIWGQAAHVYDRGNVGAGRVLALIHFGSFGQAFSQEQCRGQASAAVGNEALEALKRLGWLGVFAEHMAVELDHAFPAQVIEQPEHVGRLLEPFGSDQRWEVIVLVATDLVA